ncbi:MAG: DNA-directed RNA polymerase subunit beta' [bacterium]|nr:DNA-directed RNA polymerase subunit beta' [bacterium]
MINNDITPEETVLQENDPQEETAEIIDEEIFDKDEFEFEKFMAISIRLSSPEDILSWSYGEVKKPETINYRTFRPERGGLFCEKIFGPTRDWECFCGKFKSIRYKGVICDRCGVEVTRSDVRRRRMGHIQLVAPVSHIWYVKRIPSQISLVLDISVRDLERVIYFEVYIVIDPGKTDLKKGKLLTEDDYRQAKESYGSSFKVSIGAEAIKELLKDLDLPQIINDLREEMKKDSSIQKKKKMIKRLDALEAFVSSGNKPQWMILNVIPVIPPELRPMVQLDGGRFATSDLNDLYRRVINRNSRLSRLIELRAPDIIVRNEKRMLQESVDALFDNGRRGKVIKGPGNRPLKSLSDILKGKQGRFRQNLLGKRVDYSGRSVIVVGPELKLNQCGLPKKMALELFKPFIMEKLVNNKVVHNIKSAKKMVEWGSSEVWEILEKVIQEHPILLNRAPTLHRAGIEAFEPILVEGEAIKIHPLVCTAFNADFDGDQMAVHVPLSIETQLESKLLMLSSCNILSPANGKPLAVPSQDMVLGCYYLTKGVKGKGPIRQFIDKNEVILAYDIKDITLHEMIKVKIKNETIETTAGRVIFNNVLPEQSEYINDTLDKKKLGIIVSECYQKFGLETTVKLLDSLKELGFSYVTKAATTISIDDIKIPAAKKRLLEISKKEADQIMKEYQSGIITNEERYNKIVDLWTGVGEKIADAMYKELEKDMNGFNPIYMMIASGARGSKQQVRQLAGMRGLMAKPSGEIIELPITSNFREGLNVLEYFISTHGARKGLADTALKTADAGYLTRRLVDVAQDVIISEEDCGTINGIVISALKEGDEIVESLSDRVLGRVALEDIVDLMSGDIITKAGEEINEKATEAIEKTEIEKVPIRTVLTCESEKGTCIKCYGRNLSTGKLIKIGEAVGIIAAQSIGEPGTQLTMRTFHIGGTAYRTVEEKGIKLAYGVEIVDLPKYVINISEEKSIVSREGNLIIRKVLKEYPLSSKEDLRVFDGLWVNMGDILYTVGKKDIASEMNGVVRLDGEGKLYIVAKDRAISLKAGATLLVKKGNFVSADTVIAEFDPYNEPILTEYSGRIVYRDIILDRTIREELDENTGLFRKVVIKDREGELQPSVLVDPENGKEPIVYLIPHGARIVVNEGDKISAGETLAKFPQELSRTKDITGGLPRVAELFEARHPKEAAIVSEIDGVVEFGEVTKGYRSIAVISETGTERTYSIPIGKHLKVHNGDYMSAGEPFIEGSVDPHDILRIKGDKSLQEYLVNEVQEIYRLQGVNINDKHIEIIIKQMLRKIEINDSGDTDLLIGEQIDKIKFRKVNNEYVKKGLKPAQGKSILLGVTKASLTTESFISAASFQETTKILAEAAVKGKVDNLRGLKENVIIGRLIPAGTGIVNERNIKLILNKEEEKEDTNKSVSINENIENNS